MIFRSNLAAFAALLFAAMPAAAEKPRVIDGDTIAMSMGGRLEHIRFCAIDAPELHHAACDAERLLAIEAKQALRRMIDEAGTLAVAPGCTGESRRRDRYGRLLGELLLDGEPASARLRQAGLALPWSPGHEAKLQRQQQWCD